MDRARPQNEGPNSSSRGMIRVLFFKCRIKKTEGSSQHVISGTTAFCGCLLAKFTIGKKGVEKDAQAKRSRVALPKAINSRYSLFEKRHHSVKMSSIQFNKMTGLVNLKSSKATK